ncbi:unnamed protein product [Sphagnum tenellum]
MLNGVEIVMDYNANVGTHIDVLVCSHEKSFDEALDIVHEDIIEKIRERCAAVDGCQGVALVEGVISTECVEQRMSFKERRDQGWSPRFTTGTPDKGIFTGVRTQVSVFETEVITP